MLQITLTKIPILETSRLILRAQTPADAPALFCLRTNDQVMQYIDRDRPKDVAESEAAIQLLNDNFKLGASLIWAIDLKTDPGHMIGNLGFWRTDLANHRAEVGYILHPEHWRKGILNEALSIVLKFGFQSIGFHSLCANINPGNDASRQLLLKHGFIREAYFKEDYYFNGKFLDSEIYGLLHTHAQQS